MSKAALQAIVLGLQPSSQGFGWTAFSGPFAIHDWGLSDRGREKNEWCLRKVEQLFDRLNPQTIALASFEGAKVRRSERIVRLYKAVVALAHDRGIEVAIYTKRDILACFVTVGAKTRYEIASAVARSFDVLRDRLPPPRKAWEATHRRLPLFDAAALVLTHYRLGASQLFDDLTNTPNPT